ncbi:hypothetical protein GALL_509180 [mine drainage metagenome]|uniref:Uncharacterized protein n=1 Tax=mine drainage metagenome TaxID=410659 RepID=A0A1J5P8C1_9ZZZZ
MTIFQPMALLEGSVPVRWLGMLRTACQVAMVRQMLAIDSRTTARSWPNKVARI